jgi:ubiquitin-conjugating enzyme E2 Q
MKLHNIGEIHIEIIFSDTGYPFYPPFARVVYPRFKFHTGHITIGGSFCFELLTNSGWSSATKMESVLIQLKTLLMTGDAELASDYNRKYNLSEAKDAFHRVARQHGWN